MAYKGWSGGKSINWDAVDTEAPKPLPIGVYKAKVVKAEPKETSKGDPAASLQFKVFERHGSDEELNRKTFDNLTFTQDGAFRAKMLCEAMDIDPPETSSFEDVTEFCEELEGEEVWVHLIHNTYQGRTNNRIIQYVADGDVEDYIENLDSDGDSDEKPARKKREKAGAKASNGKANGHAKDADDLNDDAEEKPARKAKAAAEEPEERPRRRRAEPDEEEERPRRRRSASA
jgi:hypothetical protein